MLSRFSRRYSLTIGSRPPVKPEVIKGVLSNLGPSGDIVGFLDNLKVPSDAREINELQLRTNIVISKDDGGKSQQTSLTIMNLSEELIEYISQKNRLLIFRAGYGTGKEEELPILFSGQIKNVVTERVSSDLVTTITAADGYSPSTSIRLSASLTGGPLINGLSYQEVFDYLVSVWKSNGISIKNTNLIYEETLPLIKKPSEVIIERGWSYEGLLTDAMDDVCNQFDYVWYLHNNILFIHPRRSPKFRTVFTLQENQIKDIKPITSQVGGSTEKEEKGFKFNLFLNGDIKMGNRIRVPSGRFQGDYSVKSIEHELDYRGSSWNTTLITEVAT